MALVTKLYTFSLGATIVASEHNSNFDILYAVINGDISNANISGSAAILDTKLAPITSAGKVSGAALTSLSSIPLAAGLMPGANVFTAGMIIMWSGAIIAIPTGWVLCNGSNSTPDLRDRFVIGAGSTYAVNATGGSATKTLSASEIPALSIATNVGGSSFGSGSVASSPGPDDNTFSAKVNAGSSPASFSILGPYLALAYIMKT